MMEFFNRFDTKKYGSLGAPLHDPCTITYLLKPELFEGKMCNVEIETESPLTMGHTLSLIHISEPTRQYCQSRMPSSA